MDFTNSKVFIVDSIDFDWDCDEEITQQEKDTVIKSVVGKTFGVIHEDALTDLISDYTGFLVEGMSYHPTN